LKIFTSYHPALISLQALFDQFPGALAIYVFCKEEQLNVYKVEGNKDDFLPVELDISSIKPQIQSFRKLKKQVFWGDENDLPFTLERKRIQQLSIQDEIEQNLLFCRIESTTDDAYDVFVIHFAKSFSNFYIANDRNSLSSEMKVSIGKTIRNQILWLYQLQQEQRKNIQRIQLAYRNTADELNQTRETLKEERKTSHQLLNKYISQLIKQEEYRLDTSISLESNFTQVIISNGLSIDRLKQIISDACQTAFDLALDQTRIKLSASFITEWEKTKGVSHKSIYLQTLEKTYQLLDRYELAAKNLDNNNQRVNGKNLAKELSISGPAITDAIKNHGKKIKRAFERHPNKWPLIAQFIKPIREIVWSVIQERTG
jgi:hypothetical protein